MLVSVCVYYYLIVSGNINMLEDGGLNPIEVFFLICDVVNLNPSEAI